MMKTKMEVGSCGKTAENNRLSTLEKAGIARGHIFGQIEIKW